MSRTLGGCSRLFVLVASSLRLFAVMLRVVLVLRATGDKGGVAVGVGECGSSCGVLRVLLSSSSEIASSASDETSAHLVIGESSMLNGGLVSDVFAGMWVDVDKLIVMVDGAGESGHTL